MIRLRQVALVAHDLEPVATALCETFQLSICVRDLDVSEFGLTNALMVVGDQFIEIITPVTEGTAGGRMLERRGGDSGYMVLHEVDDLDDRLADLADRNVRIIWAADHHDIRGRHLHPKGGWRRGILSDREHQLRLRAVSVGGPRCWRQRLCARGKRGPHAADRDGEQALGGREARVSAVDPAAPLEDEWNLAAAARLAHERRVRFEALSPSGAETERRSGKRATREEPETAESEPEAEHAEAEKPKKQRKKTGVPLMRTIAKAIVESEGKVDAFDPAAENGAVLAKLADKQAKDEIAGDDGRESCGVTRPFRTV